MSSNDDTPKKGALLQLKSAKNKKPKDAPDFPVLRNYLEITSEGEKRPHYIPRTLPLILGEFKEKFPDMVNYTNRLCHIIPHEDRENWRKIRFLEAPENLEAEINEQGMFVDFKSRELAFNVKFKPFFIAVKNNARHVKVISDYPTWPILQGQIILSPPIEPAQNGAIDKFVDLFNPLTENDRLLMKALVVTVAWSQGQGKRPSFVIAGPHDADKTIQIGKSTFAIMVQHLFESICDVGLEPNRSNPGRLVTDLMANAHKRIIRFDNVRGGFDSALLERFVTSPYFQGHDHGKGNKQVENHTTFIVTANDPNLTVDLASRSVVIRLGLPKPDHVWLDENALSWIEDKRADVLAECAYYLTLPELKDNRPCATRFPGWERKILHKLGHDIGESIKIDQERLQDRSEENEAFKDFIYGRIISYKVGDVIMLTPEKYNVFISNHILNEWYYEFKGVRFKSNEGFHGRIIKKLCLAAGMVPTEKTIRIKSIVMRGFWFTEIQADRENYAILRRRNEDQFADLVTGKFK
jgi:hypothetical protein